MVLVHVLWLSCYILQLLITSPVEHTGDARTIATSRSILTYGMPETIQLRYIRAVPERHVQKLVVKF